MKNEDGVIITAKKANGDWLGMKISQQQVGETFSWVPWKKATVFSDYSQVVIILARLKEKNELDFSLINNLLITKVFDLETLEFLKK